MTKPMPLSDFTRLPRDVSAHVVEGLSAAIDDVAQAATPTHRFLRYQWFDAALAAYGGAARTLVVNADDRPVAALPIITAGPAWLRCVSVPGCYWPFRSFPLAEPASVEVLEELLATLGKAVRALRIGPVYDGDAAAMPLIEAARGAGWTVIARDVAPSFRLDMVARREEETWPRTSTLRKNRFHEKHLGHHGALEWCFVSGRNWPAAFDTLAEIEERSWIASRTDGRDAKFTAAGHGAFWRALAGDPLLAEMMRAAVLTVDSAPAAFSFDLDVGDFKYAIANSYDPRFAKHSPGKLLYYRNLVEAVGRGIRQVDWGAGDSGYKVTIGAEPGPMIRDWLLLRPGLPARLGRLLAPFWRRSGNSEE